MDPNQKQQPTEPTSQSLHPPGTRPPLPDLTHAEKVDELAYCINMIEERERQQYLENGSQVPDLPDVLPPSLEMTPEQQLLALAHCTRGINERESRRPEGEAGVGDGNGGKKRKRGL
ncbi:hypothetical protein EG329_007158 [Mollisiaceae sp. DMI_Dod_QoI]|nr:hypothetical protein EG329_007158 [Helotiales sp. DMI_Dod_QoI]